MDNFVKNALNEVEASGSKHMLSDFLHKYYNSPIFDDMEEKIWETEVFLPLRERPSEVWDAVEYLMSQTTEINDESVETPLERAVGCIDYYMADYLIQHGANPNYWECRLESIEEHKDISVPLENWFLEEIDVAIVNGLEIDKELVFTHVYKLVRILVDAGKLSSFYGLCLAYKEKTDEIELGKLQLKY